MEEQCKGAAAGGPAGGKAAGEDTPVGNTPFEYSLRGITSVEIDSSQ